MEALQRDLVQKGSSDAPLESPAREWGYSGSAESSQGSKLSATWHLFAHAFLDQDPMGRKPAAREFLFPWPSAQRAAFAGIR